eukprot:Anaeramoba_ignava/a182_218.p1 GENE.a182_218~~a182_218.p1  ORF type:complete len:165 (+),score=14.80 a182_218:20-514(+)
MDIITDSYDNMTLGQLYNKISEKQAQLRKMDIETSLEVQETSKKDFYDTSSSSGNYDEQDFERVLQKFKNKDAQIKSHEQVHATIGATTSPISYVYQQGPDGKMYAVGGSVRFDVSIPDDPKAAQAKLDQISKAASAAGDPSAADMSIATQANMNKLLIQMKGE